MQYHNQHFLYNRILTMQTKNYHKYVLLKLLYCLPTTNYDNYIFSHSKLLCFGSPHEIRFMYIFSKIFCLNNRTNSQSIAFSFSQNDFQCSRRTTQFSLIKDIIQISERSCSRFFLSSSDLCITPVSWRFLMEELLYFP